MLGRDGEAGDRLDQALTANELELGTEHLAVGNTHWLIGLCQWRSGDPEAGQESWQHASRVFLAVEGENGLMYRFARSQLLAGEGQVDGSSCTNPDCDGGVIKPKQERDEPEPDDYDEREDRANYGRWGYEG